MPKLLPLIEHVVKGPVWDCQMCGQCVLHSTGMTCPMTCPKTLRNGPCGGVREDGHCEVKPEMKCVWLKGYERSESWPLPKVWKEEFNHSLPKEIVGHQKVGQTQHLRQKNTKLNVPI
jgi:hypothetical protein